MADLVQETKMSGRPQSVSAATGASADTPKLSAKTPAFDRLKNPPRFASNALIGLLFAASTALIVIGIFFALSGDADRTVQALPILQINLLLLATLVILMEVLGSEYFVMVMTELNLLI